METGFPRDFLAVHGDTVQAFAHGRPADAPQAGARLVLHWDLSPGLRRELEATGSLCVPGSRLLALLEPEAPAAAPPDARALGERYLRAAALIAPHSEVLRAAAQLLPERDAQLRSLLHRTLAEIAVASLAGTHRKPSRSGRPVPGPGFDWPRMQPHDLLDRAFRHLLAIGDAPGGVPFEPRPGQVEMAHAVLDAFLAGEALVVEAGTGTGKTIAYALPALVLAATRGGRFLFSTHTRPLQHQLAARDLPALWCALGLDAVPRPDGEGQGLRFAKLLGRSNYVCRTALRAESRAAAARGQHRFDLAQALVWSLRRTSGELEDLASVLDPAARSELASRTESCQGRTCRGDDPCPVYAAREAARAADLVVGNHALLFSDAAAEGNLLGRFDGVVLDEAHHLEAVATEHASVRLGRARADAFAAPVARLQSALESLGREAPSAARLERHAAAAAAVRRQLLQFLATLGTTLPRPARAGRHRYADGDEVFGSVRGARAALATALADLESESRQLGEALGSGDPDRDEAASCVDLLTALAAETAAALEFLATGSDEDWAFYLDVDADGVREIAASPLDVASTVQRVLESAGGAPVYTSATLAVGGRFDHLRARLGIAPTVSELVVPSPFDFASQCLVVQAQQLPVWDDPEHDGRAADLVAAIARRTGRRTLVLHTSHAALRRLHAALRDRLGPQAPVWAQDLSGGREELARRFAATPGAVLLGTASFWEGVDFPGRAVEIVVIAKLPFLVPDDPLVAARCERLRSRGDDPFGDYVLPQAVLRFKQGFGRLVRSTRDRGVVLLLDPRLEERSYGAVFRAALPVEAEVFSDCDALVERVATWLETHAPG